MATINRIINIIYQTCEIINGEQLIISNRLKSCESINVLMSATRNCEKIIHHLKQCEFRESIFKKNLNGFHIYHFSSKGDCILFQPSKIIHDSHKKL